MSIAAIDGVRVKNGKSEVQGVKKYKIQLLQFSSLPQTI